MTESLNREEALAFLMKDGELSVPCSRYGSTTSDCAEVAWLAALEVQDANGEDITEDLLDHLMSLVVNDHDDIAHLVNDISYEWSWTAAKQSAEKMGEEAGRAAASWVFDGNTDDDTYRRILAGLDDGDPEVLDSLPFLDLSGEWADGPDPREIVRDILSDADVSRWTTLDDEDWFSDELIDAYRDSFDSAVSDEVERVAREHVEHIDQQGSSSLSLLLVLAPSSVLAVWVASVVLPALHHVQSVLAR